MRHWAVLVVGGVIMFMGCGDDPVEPMEQGPYEVTTLRTLPKGTDAGFVDLNENGQALWHEGEQAVLWDNGEILEVPTGLFLGEHGTVLGYGPEDRTISIWKNGELTVLDGSPEGILDDGTVYFTRNHLTLYTWRDGVVEQAELQPQTADNVLKVGPEGRIWGNRLIIPDPDDPMAGHHECGFELEGEWNPVISGEICSVRGVEENGWGIAYGALFQQSPLGHEVVPARYKIISENTALDLAGVNSQGYAVAYVGILGKPDDTRIDLRQYFEDSFTLGAINDDGEILAQLDAEVVLLTPR